MKRVWLWVFRHHRCRVCRLPRPVWMRGEHTSCLLYDAERVCREEVARLKRMGAPR